MALETACEVFMGTIASLVDSEARSTISGLVLASLIVLFVIMTHMLI